MAIQNKSFAEVSSAMNNEGLVVSKSGKIARKFTGEQAGLAEGTYTPLIAGGMPSNEQKGRSGNPFDALAYKNAKGVTVQIGINGITSPIMVLDQATDATKWDGVMPAKSFYRYGKLSDIGLPANQKTITDGVNQTTLYDANEFTLSKKVQYIVPDFEEFTRADGSVGRRPVYKPGCAIRTVWAVGDFDKYPAAGDNTSLPAKA